MQERLFFIAPDVIHLAAVYDPHTGYWSVRGTSTTVGPDGEPRTDEGERYEDLTAEEACDVAEMVLRGRLGLL